MLTRLGVLRAGVYVPGADGRGYGDLALAEKLDVIEAHYRAIHGAARARRAELQEEAERVLAMQERAARVFHMEQVKLRRPNDYAYLAQLVRDGWQRNGYAPTKPGTATT